MSKRKINTMFPEVVKPRKLSQVKDKDEKRFMVENAARTMERSAEVKREIADMKQNGPELFTAAQAKIDQKVTDLKAAKKS